MPRYVRSLVAIMMLSGLGLASIRCGSTMTGAPSPGTVIDPPFGEARPSVTVTSAPSGAEVWVGPGTIEGPFPGVDGHPTSARLLGRTPVTASLAPGDASPEGDLEYSVRYQGIHMDGRIANASRIIEAGGSVRIHADLHATLTRKNSTTE